MLRRGAHRVFSVLGRNFPRSARYTTGSSDDRLRITGRCISKTPEEFSISCKNRSEKRAYSTCSGQSDIIGVSVSEGGKKVDVKWRNGKISSIHGKWLRMNCRSPICVDYETTSWQYPISDIPLSLTVKDVKLSDDGSFRVYWKEDDHEGLMTEKFLKTYDYTGENFHKTRKDCKMTFFTDQHVPVVSWIDVQRSDEYLYGWLRHINVRGLCLLTDVPTEKDYMKNVLQSIALISPSFYGELWEVYKREEPINLAYGAGPLGLHMDLAVYEAQPGIQFLHCLRFDEDIKGGETNFADMYHVVDLFRKDYPSEFRLLTKVPFTFSRIHYKRENPVHMLHRRPIIYVNDEDEVIGVSWHLAEHSPPLIKEEIMEAALTAYQLFARFLTDFPYKTDIRLEAGQMICFNNRRLSHGRNAFFGGAKGVRHFQGGYVNVDDFKSKLLVLSTKYDGGKPAVRMGNMDWT